MLTRRYLLTSSAMGLLGGLGLIKGASTASAAQFAVTHSDAEWRRMLSPAAYDVLRQSGTEAPFTSPLLNQHGRGIFACAGCNSGVFSSDTKFESGTGWPSFWAPLTPQAVTNAQDSSLGMDRTAVACATCGGHLGHVFNDGPKPTGLRYCMNGVAMTFRPGAA